jgi:hypothetical protein
VRTSKQVREEWERLWVGYPDRGTPFAHATFNVLAPIVNGRRRPVYEHPNGPADVEEVWGLALKIAEAVRRVVQ